MWNSVKVSFEDTLGEESLTLESEKKKRSLLDSEERE